MPGKLTVGTAGALPFLVGGWKGGSGGVGPEPLFNMDDDDDEDAVEDEDDGEPFGTDDDVTPLPFVAIVERPFMGSTLSAPVPLLILLLPLATTELGPARSGETERVEF